MGLCTVGQSISSGWTITITVNSWPCPTLQPWLTVTNFGCFLTGLCNIPSQSGGGNSGGGGGGAGAGQGGAANNGIKGTVRADCESPKELRRCVPARCCECRKLHDRQFAGQLCQTCPADNPNNGFNGGNSTTTIDANNFANADPVTQTGVVVHEWFHQMQINNSYLFRFKVFFNRQGVEAEANAAAKEAIQKCGPG